jgi:folate-binding protein YgfZ
VSLEAFRQTTTSIDLSDRSKLQFTGDQAFWFLDQLLTNKLDELAPGSGADALLLTPKGRIVAPLRVIAAGKSAHVDGPPGMGEELKSFFEGRVFTTKVEVSDRTDDFAIVAVLGPRSDELSRQALEALVAGETTEQRDLGLVIPGETEHETTHFGASVLVRVTRPVRGLEVWVRSDRKDELTAALSGAGVGMASGNDYFDLCTLEGVPHFGVDFDNTFLPQEAALEGAVHFEKGCYLGQESVAMAQRGRIKRRLRRVRFEGTPLVGTARFENAEAGRVTSAAADGSGGFGIGTIKTTVPLGERVQVVGDGTTANAVVEEIPGTVEGPAVPSARELREQLNKPR